MADAGLTDLALHYTEAVVSTLKQIQGQPNAHKNIATFLSIATEHSNRLRTHGVTLGGGAPSSSSAGAHGAEGGSWFSGGSFRSLLDKGLDLVIGDGEQAQSSTASSAKPAPDTAPLSASMSWPQGSLMMQPPQQPSHSMGNLNTPTTYPSSSSYFAPAPQQQQQQPAASAVSTAPKKEDKPKEDNKPKPADKKTEDEAGNSGNLFNRIGGYFFGGKKRVEVNLGGEMEFKYDPVQKRWVNASGNPPPSAAPPPPPPKASSFPAPSAQSPVAAAPSPMQPYQQQPQHYQPHLQPQPHHNLAPLQTQQLQSPGYSAVSSPASAVAPAAAPGLAASSAAGGGSKRRPARSRYVDVINPNSASAPTPNVASLLTPVVPAYASATPTMMMPMPVVPPQSNPSGAGDGGYSYYGSSDFQAEQNELNMQQQQLAHQHANGADRDDKN